MVGTRQRRHPSRVNISLMASIGSDEILCSAVIGSEIRSLRSASGARAVAPGSAPSKRGRAGLEAAVASGRNGLKEIIRRRYGIRSHALTGQKSKFNPSFVTTLPFIRRAPVVDDPAAKCAAGRVRIVVDYPCRRVPRLFEMSDLCRRNSRPDYADCRRCCRIRVPAPRFRVPLVNDGYASFGSSRRMRRGRGTNGFR
jgi:hypothetical protein